MKVNFDRLYFEPIKFICSKAETRIDCQIRILFTFFKKRNNCLRCVWQNRLVDPKKHQRQVMTSSVRLGSKMVFFWFHTPNGKHFFGSLLILDPAKALKQGCFCDTQTLWHKRTKLLATKRWKHRVLVWKRWQTSLLERPAYFDWYSVDLWTLLKNIQRWAVP